MPSSKPWNAWCAFAACLVYAVGLGAVITGITSPALSYVFLTAHLLMFVVVGALPAPVWAKAAGWGWLSMDSMLDIAQLNGMADDLVWQVRLGAHLPGALWLFTTSWVAGGPVRLGLLVGLYMGGFSLVAPRVPVEAFYPAFPLLVVWLAIVGWWLSRHPATAGPPRAVGS